MTIDIPTLTDALVKARAAELKCMCGPDQPQEYARQLAAAGVDVNGVLRAHGLKEM